MQNGKDVSCQARVAGAAPTPASEVPTLEIKGGGPRFQEPKNPSVRGRRDRQ